MSKTMNEIGGSNFTRSRGLLAGNSSAVGRTARGIARTKQPTEEHGFRGEPF